MDFDINIFGSVSVYDPDLYFRESDDEYFLYTEASSEGVTKGNFLQKAWQMLKRALSWCLKQLKRLAKFIGDLFHKKSINKSADQVVKETFGEISKSSLKTPSKNATKSGNGKPVTISASLSSDKEKSDVSVPTEIDIAFKAFHIEFIQGSDKIRFTTQEWINDAVWNGLRNLEQPGHPLVDATSGFAALIYVSDNQLKKEFFKMVECCAGIISTDDPKEIKKNIRGVELSMFAQAKRNIMLIPKQKKLLSMEISLKELVDFQQGLSASLEKLTKIDHVRSPKMDDYNRAVKLFNNCMNLVAGMQFALNGITGAVKDVFKIDASYCEICNDVDKFAKFAKNMIDAGIPTKFISYNLYLIADKSIKGNGSERKPTWGQTRVVFFPPNNANIIYKVALSGYGTVCNKTEIDISKKMRAEFKNDLASCPIPLVQDSKGDATLLVAERVDELTDANTDNIQPSTMKSLCKKLGIPTIGDYSIEFDHNVGQRPGTKHAVILDYGITTRNPNKPNKPFILF